MLDKLKDQGFKYSTIAGITVSAADVVRSDAKEEIIAEAKSRVDKINKQYQKGLNLADNLVKENKKIEYQKDLHNNSKQSS